MPSPSAAMPTSIDRTYAHGTAEASHSFEHLVREHYPYIRRLSLSILDDGSPDPAAEADDAAQETFITAYRALTGFRGQSSLKTWLTSIAVKPRPMVKLGKYYVPEPRHPPAAYEAALPA